MSSCQLIVQNYMKGTFGIGAYGEATKLILQADVLAYAQLLGDSNPLHTDAAFAATTQFKRPIAHGMIAGGLFGTIFGAQIRGSLYVSQSLKFKRPVYVGDSVRARVTVTALRELPARAGDGAGGAGAAAARSSQLHVTCSTVVHSVHDDALVIDGEAVVLIPWPAPTAPAPHAPTAQA